MNEWLDSEVKNFIVDHQPIDLQMQAFRISAESRHIPIIQPDVEHMIRWLIRSRSIQSILEVGTATGYSAISFARVMPKGRIVTLERNEDRYGEALENIRSFGLETVIDPQLGDARTLMKNIKRRFDMIFLDASKSHYHEFLDDSIKLLSRDGIIISDNVLFGGRVVKGSPEKRNRTSTRQMKEFLDYISEPPFDTVILPIGDGLSLTTIARGDNENE